MDKDLASEVVEDSRTNFQIFLRKKFPNQALFARGSLGYYSEGSAGTIFNIYSNFRESVLSEEVFFKCVEDFYFPRYPIEFIEHTKIVGFATDNPMAKIHLKQVGMTLQQWKALRENKELFNGEC